MLLGEDVARGVARPLLRHSFEALASRTWAHLRSAWMLRLLALSLEMDEQLVGVRVPGRVNGLRQLQVLPSLPVPLLRQTLQFAPLRRAHWRLDLDKVLNYFASDRREDLDALARVGVGHGLRQRLTHLPVAPGSRRSSILLPHGLLLVHLLKLE